MRNKNPFGKTVSSGIIWLGCALSCFLLVPVCLLFVIIDVLIEIINTFLRFAEGRKNR